MHTQTLHVALADRSYPIDIGTDLLASLGERILPYLASRHVVCVTNATIAPLYLQTVQAALEQAGITCQVVLLEDGEAYKDQAGLERIYAAMLSARCDRKTTLLALGGGVVGDMTGFAAATYMRGVAFIQVPTTLLSQVDSSVGGKTGINHPLGKNMIGAFYQPKAVIADMHTLATLPAREFSAGMAEVIKYGLIDDAPFFEWLEAHIDALMAQHPQYLAEAVAWCCRNKARIVAEDETESGVRALLNLGHTFGHAIEAGMGYGVWLHGEAVAAGMVMAAELSCELGWIDAALVARIRALLLKANLPVVPPQLGEAQYLSLMQVDKKNEDGKIRFILLTGLGRSVISSEAPIESVRAVIKRVAVGPYLAP